jgi:ribosomal-protein-alanine N-acetyltransferase
MHILTAIPGIVLRPPRPEDAGQLSRIADSPQVYRMVRDAFPHPYTPEHAREFIHLCLEKDPVREFAITEDDLVIGMTGYHPQTDVYRFSAELGYFIAVSHWGKGIATAAVRALAGHAFRSTDLHRLYAGVFSSNPASMRVLEKAGFRPEGIAEGHVFKGGRFQDEHRYALLSDNFHP